MKTYNDFLNEGKKFKTKEEFLTHSKNWVSNDSLERILNGQDSYAFHGSNRDFDKFDMSFLREWRAEMFLGKGIFLTPSREVAEKYADANANGDLPITILKDAEKIDKKLAKFMSDLYYKGNITWEDSTKFIQDEWNFPIDPNDVCNLVNLIPGSQSAKDYEDERYKGWDEKGLTNC